MKRNLIGTVIVLLSHLVAVAVLLMVLIRLVPKYAHIFADFRLTLPAISQFTVAMSQWAGRYWYLLVPALAIDAVVYFLLASLGPKFNWLASVWAGLVLVFTILLVGVLVVGMCLPLQHLPLGR